MSATPTGRLLGTWPTGSPKWHQARLTRVSGSEIAAVLGLSPYESHFSLWMRKKGHIGPVQETPIMRAGKLLEPAILQSYAEDHPDTGVRAAPGLYVHKDRDWQSGSPDGIGVPVSLYSSRPDVLLEAKYALYDYDWGTPGTDEIPVHYAAQCRWYLDVLGLDEAHLQVFIGSAGEFRTYIIRQDQADIDLMRTAAVDFLASLAADKRPDIDQHGSTYQAIRELHPDIDPVDVELAAATARTYCAARRALKAAEGVEQHARSLVADELGNGKRATYLGSTIATRQARGDGDPYVVAGRNLPHFTETSAAA